MTLPSRKKHQITQPNTAQAIINCLKHSIIECVGKYRLNFCYSKRAWLVVALIGSAVNIGVCDISHAQESPLKRLQKRSANQRWREATAEWIPIEESKNSPEVPSEEQNEPSNPVLAGSLGTLQKQKGSSDSKNVGEKDSKELLEGMQLDTSFSLFEPFPGRRMEVNKFTKTTTATTNIISSPQPFPNSNSQPIPELDRSESVDDVSSQPTVISQSNQQTDKQLPIISEFQPAIDERRIAFQDRVPPAPKGTLERPEFRKISEIKPYHDYVPASTLSATQKETKPIIASEPKYIQLDENGSLTGSESATYYHWMASNLTHDPLYFEDVSLERYGHTYPLQPFVSISKFGLQVLGLPYQMALNPMGCEQYPLGYYRPGDCAPFLRHRVPFNQTAATTAAGVYTGLIFLIP